MGGARLAAKYKTMYVSITAPMQLTYSIHLRRRRGEMMHGIKERFIGIACLLSLFFSSYLSFPLFYLVFSQAHWIKWKCGKHGWLWASYIQSMHGSHPDKPSYCVSILFHCISNFKWLVECQLQMQATAFWVMHIQLVSLGLWNKFQVWNTVKQDKTHWMYKTLPHLDPSQLVSKRYISE